MSDKFTGVVLALDLATTTGWAVGRPGETPLFGSIRFAKPASSRAVIYRAFRDWLESEWNVRDNQPDLIVFESAAVPSIMMGRTNISTIKLLVGLCEHLEEWAYGKVELREASVQQVRAHFIGSNPKSAIAKAATLEQCKRLGWNPATHDEADACALWDYQVACLRPDIAVASSPLFRVIR